VLAVKPPVAERKPSVTEKQDHDGWMIDKFKVNESQLMFIRNPKPWHNERNPITPKRIYFYRQPIGIH